jgi:hypothetical protein
MTEAAARKPPLHFSHVAWMGRAVDVSVVPLLDVIRSLAFVGDLAMGQPGDHSPRAAWMAGQLAKSVGADAAGCTRAVSASLLRWSGCTANAPEFAQLFGDDVNGRKALLAAPSAGSGFRAATRHQESAFLSLSRIHCEVAGDVAAQLGLDDETQFTLRHLFESYDGTRAPTGLRGDQVPTGYTLLRWRAISTSSTASTVWIRRANSSVSAPAGCIRRIWRTRRWRTRPAGLKRSTAIPRSAGRARWRPRSPAAPRRWKSWPTWWI